MTKRNRLILLTSFISLLPIGFIVWDLVDLIRISSPNWHDEAYREEVLNLDISSLRIWLPLSIESIVIVFSVILFNTKYDHDNSLDRTFRFLLIFFGGIGLHFVAWAFLRKNKRKIRNLLVGSIVLSSTSLIGFGGAGLWFSYNDSPSDSFLNDTTVYSTKEGAYNLIEIFPDGFDKVDVLANKDKYSTTADFNFYSKYITSGGITHLTMPTIYSSFYEHNPIKIWHTGVDKYYTSKIYGKDWYKTGIEMLNRSKTQFDTTTIINPILISNDPDYGNTTQGTPRSIVKDAPGVGVVNWSGARDALIGKWGIGNLSPDGFSYRYANKSGKVANTNAKGAHVIINDLITHPPHITDDESLKLNGISTADKQGKVLFKTLDKLFNSLKSRKGPNGRSIYDNSMIIVYGDHNSHSRVKTDGNEAENAVFNGESSLLIKYPNQHIGKTVNDRLIYSPQIKAIIRNFVNNQSATNWANFIETDSRFNMRTLPFFYGDDYDKFTMVNYSGSHIVPIGHPFSSRTEDPDAWNTKFQSMGVE